MYNIINEGLIMSEKTTTTRTSFWSLNKISFYTMATAAILYLVAAILSTTSIPSTTFPKDE